MNDKSDILASLMEPELDRENMDPGAARRSRASGQQMLISGCGPGAQRGQRTATSGRQHKLKQRFTVIRKLGKGTYGKVQLAINKETGQEVAIKTIKKTKIENEQDLQRVRREIQIMSSIEHPHIIHIYEVFENKDKIVLVMQYAPGGELYEYVSKAKCLEDAEARRLFRQIATAIFYCHQNKICHRDLKLENILLDEKNNAKIADFGLSNVFDKSRQLKTFCGSPLYASPEIVQGSPYEGPEVDCWSLGVLLYTLVYGAMPFDGSNFKRLVKQISESSYYEPEVRSTASPLIRRLLCANPLKRATILDICTDPWVNGSVPTPLNSISLSPTMNGEQQQTSPSSPIARKSLLKVAQDMAKLTPVRLDILLALAPQTEPPTARVEPVPEKIEEPINEDFGGDNKEAAKLLDQAEEETTRACSPMASYIVRDLDDDVPVQSQDTVEAEIQIEQPTEEVRMEEQNPDVASVEIEETADSGTMSGVAETEESKPTEIERESRDTNSEAVEMSIQSQEISAEQLSAADNTVDDEKERNEGEQKMDQGVDNLAAEQTVQQTQDVQVKSENNLPVAQDTTNEVKMDVEVECEAAVVEAEVSQQEATSKVADTSEAVTTGEKQSEPEAMAQDDQQLDTPATEDSGAKAEATAEPAEKQKKVKKKIVVVKKKKRISKKVDAASGETQTTESDKKTVGVNNDNDTKQEAVAASRAPGKVKIPDTFQSAGASEQAAEQPPKAVTEGRRQSALVADVSQRLLQQSAQQASAVPSIIESDQPQLASVRVSDKKSEFERRTSLAQANTDGISIKSISPKPEADVTTTPAVSEDKNESLRDLKTGEEAQLESFDHVQVEGQEESPTQADAEASPGVPKSPILVAESGMKGDLIEDKSEETSLAVANDLIQEPDTPNSFKSTLVEPPSPSSLASPAEESTVRSSFSISLSNKADEPKPIHQQSQQSAARQQLAPLRLDLAKRQADQSTSEMPLTTEAPSTCQSIAGPAPIARSYKKVTFTKDGACITETGRIYATKAEDGTVRRVERKSKVTHYPSSANTTGTSTSTSSVQRQHQATLAKTSETQAGDEWSPFERLIMPSAHETDLFGQQQEDLFDMFRERKSSIARPGSQHRDQFAAASPHSPTCSSCSSGSTDALDDIFDHWTGAISMFRPMMGDKRGGQRRGQHRGRHQGAGGSLAGTPRCGSAGGDRHDPFHQPLSQRPGTATGHRHTHRGRSSWRDRSETPSGYESDAPTERPASALGSARGRTFGSSNLFQPFEPSLKGFSISDDHGHTSPFDELDGHNHGELSLEQSIERHHEALRRRLAQQHQQLWKGSTPSLFENSSRGSVFDDGTSEWRQSLSARRRQPPGGPLGQLLMSRDDHGQQQQVLPPSALPPRAQRSTSGLRQVHVNLATQSRPRESADASCGTAPVQTHSMQNLEQSQSSSSFLRQSVPLKPAPNRQRPPNLPAVHRSTSRQTITMSSSASTTTGSGQQAIEQIQVQKQQQQQQKQVISSASFIELKRNATPGSQQPVAIQQREQQVRAESERLISTSTCSSSPSASFWPESITTSSRLGGAPEAAGHSSTSFASTADNVDSRVQDWLQDSQVANQQQQLAGSLSTSSGSKSSVSDLSRATTTTTTAGSAFGSSYHQPVAKSNQSATHIVFQPQSIAESMAPSFAAAEATTSQSSKVLVTSSSTTSYSTSAAQQQQLHLKQQVSQAGSTAKTSQTTMSKTFVTSLRQQTKSPELMLVGVDDDTNDGTSSTHSLTSRNQAVQRRQLHVTSSTSSSSRLSHQQTPGSAPVRPKSFVGSSWQEAEESHLQQVEPTTPNSLDSPSALDLDLDSPSSLLDQLRSRGYRSMINQRLVSGTSASSSGQQLAAADGGSSIVEGAASNASSVVRHSEESCSVQHQELVTSSATSAVQTSTTSSSSTRQMRSSQQSSSRRVYTSSTSSSVTSSKTPKQQHVAILDELSDEVERADTELKSEFPAEQNGREAKLPEVDPEQQVLGGSRNEEQQNKEENHLENGDLEEMDDDVRAAKENIKAHVERMRETESFLKSLQAEEEKTERERKQMFQLDNLLLSAKLNGIRQQSGSKLTPTGDDMSCDSQQPLGAATNGSYSAHIRPQSFGSSWLSNGSASHMGFSSTCSAPIQPSIVGNGGFDWTTWNPTRIVHKQSLGFLHEDEPSASGPSTPPITYNSSTQLNHRRSMQKLNMSPFVWDQHSPYSLADSSPTTTYSPPSYNVPVRREFRRSKSQLGDQFTGGRRPLSVQLTPNATDFSLTDEPLASSACDHWTPPPARAKRAISQVRYSSRSSQPPTSEYRSSFVDYSAPRMRYGKRCESSNDLTTSWRSSAMSDCDRVKRSDHNNNDEDDSEDLGLSAYRVDAYIPRSRRDTRESDTEEVSSSRSTRRVSLDETRPSERKSYTSQTADSTPVTAQRRMSLSGNDTRADATTSQVAAAPGSGGGQEKSRLQELESRLAENRRRREELLASNQALGSPSSKRVQRKADTTTDADIGTYKKRASSPAQESAPNKADQVASTSPKISINQAPMKLSSSRPSRLESMEARIKRRSYCVRMSSLERARQSGGGMKQWQTSKVSGTRARSPCAGDQ